MRIGKSIGHSVKIMERFDSVHGIKKQSSAHSRYSSEKDLKLLLKEVSDGRVFDNIPGRNMSTFQTPSNSIKHASVAELKEWMNQELKKLMTYRPT